MEELLRTYYANLNPQATEEEILAYLQSQGIDMSAPQGIASLAPRVMPESGGIDNIITGSNLPVGSKPPSAGLTALGYLINPFIGGAMSLSRLADKGKLPGGLNRIFGSRASGDVEVSMPQTIQTGQGFVDEVALTGGDSGGSFDGASSMESYSQDPTGYSGSF